MLWSVRCAVCDQPGEVLCPACREGLRPAPRVLAPPGLSTCHALLAYEGAGRELVLGLKYRNGRVALARLAEALAALVDAAGLASAVDLVTWAPTSPARRRTRGFDQAELLARGAAHHLARRCPALLTRRSATPQTGRSRAERLAGPVFAAAPVTPGARILLVDDVVTTGATLTAAAAALTRAGAGPVHAVVTARAAATTERAETA